MTRLLLMRRMLIRDDGQDVVDEGVVDEEEDGENVVEADVVEADVVDVVDILCFAFAQKGFF